MAETVESIGYTCGKRDVQGNEQYNPQIHISNYGIGCDEEARFKEAYRQGYTDACAALPHVESLRNPYKQKEGASLMQSKPMHRQRKPHEDLHILVPEVMQRAQEVCQLDNRFRIENGPSGYTYLCVPPELSKRDYASLCYHMWGGTNSAFLRKLRLKKQAQEGAR